MVTEKIHATYQEFINKRTYSRWVEEMGRRESWLDSCNRFEEFFAQRGQQIPVDFIKSKDVMPSMRAFWSAGPALEENNIAAYNCAYIAIDSLRKFSEMLYILMHGTGVGFSVERQYIAQLPTVPEQFVEVMGLTDISDDKLGWAQSLEHLLTSLFNGYTVRFDYSHLRPKGARLKTFGGTASGPEPLMALHKFVTATVKKAAGRKLNSLEVHDICCKIAECVVVGGVRRSACISFSNLSDQRMKHAKDGQFWVEAPQRHLANNSVAYTEKPDCAIFTEEWLNLLRSGSGERGVFNVQAAERKAQALGRKKGKGKRANPCGEAILDDEEFCNLTEVIVKTEDTIVTLKEKIDAAVKIGCIQSTLTDFKYISPNWKENCEEERLLGVSLTGTCDNRLLQKVNDKTRAILRELKEYAHERAKYHAGELGIAPPRQVTLVKPSGTVSQLVNCASGIHPRYADYYLRRVRVNFNDPVASLLIDKGIPCQPETGESWGNCNTVVFDFPIKSPRGSLQRSDFTAIEQLEYWQMFNECWCDGNPSVTIYVKEDEWIEVGAWVYKNWDNVCGLTFLPYDGGTHPLPPYTELTREEYYEMCKPWKTIDIDFDRDLPKYESRDMTVGAQTFACTGTSCEL